MRYSRLSSLSVLIGALVVTLGGSPARAQTPCDPATDPLGVSLAQFVAEPGGYLPGYLLEITLRVTAACWEQYEGADLLGITQLTPPGWTYDSLVSVTKAAIPDLIPAHGAKDEFGFVWDPAPELPVTLTYRLFVPKGECSTKQVYGKATYTLDGVPYESDLAVTDVPDARLKGRLCCGETAVTTPGSSRGDMVVLLAAILCVFAFRQLREYRRERRRLSAFPWYPAHMR